MKLPLKYWPDESLKTKCQSWDFDNVSQELATIETDMIETMLSEHGIGLAANQVGILYRVLVIEVQETKEIIVMYNPEITTSSEETWTAREGCLSFPKIDMIIGRSKSVTVTWQDKNRIQYTRQFNTIDAKCLSHEIDHLDGITFNEIVSQLKFSRAIMNSKKR